LVKNFYKIRTKLNKPFNLVNATANQRPCGGNLAAAAMPFYQIEEVAPIIKQGIRWDCRRGPARVAAGGARGARTGADAAGGGAAGYWPDNNFGGWVKLPAAAGGRPPGF
ncbi:hypothetical protein OAK19_00350, partial [Aureispira]|nr:hypothetical protein [Aureispira sp.]